MLPNDPLLALREAHATMARRANEATQSRLANGGQHAGRRDRVRSDRPRAHSLVWLLQLARILRRLVPAHHG